MLSLLKKFWKPLAIILLVASLLGGFSHWRYTAGHDAADLDWSKKWAERNAADSEASRKRDAREREEEKRRQLAANEERRRAEEQVAKVQADADAAQRAGDGLQHQLAVIQDKYGRSETGRLSALAAAGAAKAETARVLAQLLSESDRLAGKFAAEADANYIAGSACERMYNRVTAQ